MIRWIRESILGKIAVVAGLTLLTNILGFGREMLTAYHFGISAETDAFFTAFSLVSFGFLIFSAGALQGAFMPHYQKLLQHQHEQAPAILRRFGLQFFLLCVGLCLFFAACAKPLVELFFDFDDASLTIRMLATLSPIILFMGLGALLQSVMHAHHRFTAAAAVPLGNNIVIISALLLLVPVLGIWGMATGYILGAAMWILILLPLSQRYFRTGTLAGAAQNDARIIWLNLLPLVVLLATDQFSAVAQKAFVSHLEAGAISSLHYAAKIAGLPIGIFAGAVCTVFFPQLADAFARRDLESARNWLTIGICATGAITIPASVLLMIDSHLVIQTLMERGKFDAQATTVTALGLFWFAIALLPQALMVFLTRLYFSAERYRLAVTIGVINSLLQIVLSWFAVQWFGYIGIPVASSVSALIYASMLLYYARRLVPLDYRTLARSHAKILLGCVAMAGAISLVPNGHGIVSLALDLAVGGSVYLACLWVLREPTIRQLIKL